MGSTRRMSIAFLLAATFAIATAAPLSVVHAKDGGGSGGGGGGSGHGGGGGDDGGGDSHGGRGGGDDHGGGAAGAASTGSGSDGADYNRARDAVRNGQIMSLKAILQKIDVERYGRIIDIRLGRSQSQDIYQVKMRDDGGVIRTLNVDARSGAVIGRN